MANFVLHGPFIPDQSTQQEAQVWARAYQDGASSLENPNIEGPQVPEVTTSEVLRVLWRNFTHGISDRRMELAILQQHALQQPVPHIVLAPQNRAPKVQDPEDFNGTRSKFTRFMTRLALVFASDPTRYNNDAAKIAYAASYLTGSASDWFESHLDKTTGAVDFENYAAFATALQNADDDPNARATAERKLRALKQGLKDCSTYHAEFATYATVLNYDNLTKRSFFTEGANQGLKDALSYQISLPDDFNEFIKVCIKLDNNVRLRVPSPPASTAAGSSTPGPMDFTSTDRTSRKRGPLTEAQRKYRYENGLCLYCGNHGHFVSDCPHSKKKKLNAAAPATSPSDAPLVEVAKN